MKAEQMEGREAAVKFISDEGMNPNDCHFYMMNACAPQSLYDIGFDSVIASVAAFADCFKSKSQSLANAMNDAFDQAEIMDGSGEE